MRQKESRRFGFFAVLKDAVSAPAVHTGHKDRITAREMDVLHCMVKGLSNQDIAKALGISEKTVKNHLSGLFHKLKVKDRTQALIYVLKNKIVSLE